MASSSNSWTSWAPCAFITSTNRESWSHAFRCWSMEMAGALLLLVFGTVVYGVAQVRASHTATLKLEEAERFAQGSLDSLETLLGIVDGGGVLVAVKQPWQRACDKSHGDSPWFRIGDSYFQRCDEGYGPSARWLRRRAMSSCCFRSRTPASALRRRSRLPSSRRLRRRIAPRLAAAGARVWG